MVICKQDKRLTRWKEVACHTEDATSCRKSHHPERVKKDLTNRLKRIEGQIR